MSSCSILIHGTCPSPSLPPLTGGGADPSCRVGGSNVGQSESAVCELLVSEEVGKAHVTPVADGKCLRREGESVPETSAPFIKASGGADSE